MSKIKTLSILVLLIFAIACNQNSNVSSSAIVVEPEWIADATIYEVNIRQFTEVGTFNAFLEHLPRLKELGVKILWIMPVQPISVKNRKGSLGSYYSIANYKAVNPEFGTMEDFKNLVNESHKLGFKVIIDWVANHTGWDNQWILDHPEWYTKDSLGNIIPPVADWSDVADLNYDVPEMRYAMIEAMDFWLEETAIDGFRCDVAWGVPQDFWEDARASFDSIKPVFMLAEDEDHPAFLEKSFHANYGWHLHHLMNQVAQKEKSAQVLKDYFADHDSVYADGAFPMQFITNHDENSWQGTVAERMADAADAFAIFSFTVPGMPLIYGGQEAGLNKRLLFFEKDEIDWSGLEKQSFYEKLVDLKTQNIALWNGLNENMTILESQENIFAFTRIFENNKVLVLINLSDVAVTFSLQNQKGKYKDWMSNNKLKIPNQYNLDLEPWEYKIYTSIK